MNDATQKKEGVSDDEGKALIAEIRKTTNDDRMSSISELAEAGKARRREEIGEDAPIDEDVEEVEEKEEVKEEVDEKTETAPNVEETEQKLDKDDEKDILKIDGKEQSIEKSRIYEAGKRALQKEFSADSRLEEATKILKEAQATAEGIKSSASQPSSQDVDDTAQYEQLAQILKDGDVDEVAKAIGKVMGTGRQTELATQAVNMQPNDVYGMVESALQVKSAMDTFQKDPEQGGYGDLWKDKTTRQMVLDKESDLAKGEDPKTPTERLDIAAGEVRQWRNDLIESSGGKVVDFTDRTTKKQSATSTPSSAGSTRTEQKDAKPKTEAEKRKEVLAKMARSRGQDLD